jgi:uncharacterized membrane protein YdjX (TVP38/TMEM64 family)
MNTENTGRLIISVLVVAAFIAYVNLIVFFHIPPDTKDIVNTAGGILGGAFTLVVTYWLGSSAGSSAKDKTISDMNTTAKTP